MIKIRPAPVHVDSSAFYALMDRADRRRKNAKAIWPSLLENTVSLRTSNYAVSETLSLIQYRHRKGLRLQSQIRQARP